MPVFEFQAIDQEGKPHKGVLHGSSLDVVAQQLAAKGWNIQNLQMASTVGDPLADQPMEPRPIRPPSRTELPPPAGQVQMDTNAHTVSGVKLEQLGFFFRQFGTMLNAGINPAQAFKTLAGQSTSPGLKAILLEMSFSVVEGRGVAEGFERYPHVFTPLMLSMVRTGEEGGFLSEQCNRIADYIQRDVELRNLIRRETAYPKMVLGASAVIIVGTNLFIKSMGKSGGIGAPMMLWFTFLAFVVAGYIFFRYALRNHAILKGWNNFVLSLPVFGNISMGFAMAKFGRAFGALWNSGVPLSKATRLAADACGNEALRERMYPAADQLDSGHGVADTFMMTGAFSPMTLDMMRTGEATGNMNEMMEKVAEYYEDESTTKARQSALFLGVFSLLAVGAYVAYIVISFYTGYYGGLGGAL